MSAAYRHPERSRDPVVNLEVVQRDSSTALGTLRMTTLFK